MWRVVILTILGLGTLACVLYLVYFAGHVAGAARASKEMGTPRRSVVAQSKTLLVQAHQLLADMANPDPFTTIDETSFMAEAHKKRAHEWFESYANIKEKM